MESEGHRRSARQTMKALSSEMSAFARQVEEARAPRTIKRQIAGLSGICGKYAKLRQAGYGAADFYRDFGMGARLAAVVADVYQEMGALNCALAESRANISRFKDEEAVPVLGRAEADRTGAMVALA